MESVKTVLVLPYSGRLNGTTTHQGSLMKLFPRVPGYAFTVLRGPGDLKGKTYDVYLNLTPPYDVRVDGEPGGNFYYYTTDWLKKSLWLPVKGVYRLLPVSLRKRLRSLKQACFRRFIGVLPPPEAWVVFCHDLTPLVRREWFSFPAHWEIDFLSNFRRARHVIAVSESTKRDLVKHGIPEEKISVVYNTYDDSFRPENKGVPPSVRDYLLVVGSLEPRKNAANVYKAFLKIKPDIPHKLVFIGGDEWGGEPVYDRIRRDPRCLILKTIPMAELLGWYQGASALVYVSWYEGFGLPVLEAAGCGIPVVCSGTSGMLESGEGYAEFADPAEPQDIAAKILQALRPDHTIRVEARLRLLEKFSVDENAERLKAALDKITAKNRLPEKKEGAHAEAGRLS
jgi:glycosyltransferase involved in cell wall biosynthesis